MASWHITVLVFHLIGRLTTVHREVVNHNKRWLRLHWRVGERTLLSHNPPFTTFRRAKSQGNSSPPEKNWPRSFHMEDHGTKRKPKIRWDILGLNCVSHLWSDLTLSLGSTQASSLFSICFTVSSKRIPASRKTVAKHHNKDCKYCISKMQSNLKTK